MTPSQIKLLADLRSGDLVSRAEVLRVLKRLGGQDADLALYGAEDNARAREYGEAAMTRACCAVAIMPASLDLSASLAEMIEGLVGERDQLKIGNRVLDGLVAEKCAALTAAEGRIKAMEEALEKTRVDVVCAIAFLARDMGTDRERSTVSGVVETLCKTDNAIREAMPRAHLEAVAQRKEHAEPDEGRQDAGSTPAGFATIRARKDQPYEA